MTSSRTLRIGLLSPVDLDPRESQDYLSSMALELLFETPFAVPEAGKPPVPLILRDRLDQVHSTEYRGRIREGIRFSDGRELSAANVVRCLNSSSAIRTVADLRLDGDEIVFSLKRPNANFELFLTQRFCSITRARPGGSLLGTGPFMLAEAATDLYARLIPNPHHRGSSEVEEIELKVYPPNADAEPEALVSALQDGEVDLTNALTRQALRQIKGLRTWFEPGNSTALLFFNTERPYISDPRVRQACALAIDRTELARTLYPDNALAFRASGLLPKSLDQWRDRLYPNPDKARRLLGEIGEDQPHDLRLGVIWCPRPYLPRPQHAADFIAEQLAAIGLDVTVEMTTSMESYQSRLRAGNYDLFLSGWVSDTPDPIDFLDSVLASELIPQRNGLVANSSNLSRWNHRPTDEALAAYRQQGPAAGRQQLIDIMNEEVPVFPLLYGSIAGAYSWRIGRCDLSALGVPRVAEIRFR